MGGAAVVHGDGLGGDAIGTPEAEAQQGRRAGEGRMGGTQGAPSH